MREIAQGRVWSGEDALDIGLADSPGALKDAIAVAAGKTEPGEGPWRLRILPRPKTPFEAFNDLLLVKSGRRGCNGPGPPPSRNCWSMPATPGRCRRKCPWR